MKAQGAIKLKLRCLAPDIFFLTATSVNFTQAVLMLSDLG